MIIYKKVIKFLLIKKIKKTKNKENKEKNKSIVKEENKLKETDTNNINIKKPNEFRTKKKKK